MFVEQSEARLRRVRIGFVLLCLVPTVGLVVWAFQRHSSAHRETMAAEVTRLLSTEVAFESLRHLQPGCLRLSGVRLGGASLGTVGVETTPTEVRLLLDRCECSPAFAGQLATLARRWLTEPARFPQNCVIDIAGMAWKTTTGEVVTVQPLRVECVANAGDRAVRIISPERTTDEMRIVRTAEPDTTLDRSHWEVDVTLTEPMPMAVILAVLGQSPLAGWQLGPEAVVTGTMQTKVTADGWAGQASGRVVGVDLGEVTATLPYRAEGLATLEVAGLIWTNNRVSAAEFSMVSPRGTLAQEWLDGLISIIGCRAAPAAMAKGDAELREFEQFALRVAVDGSGARLQAESHRAGCLMESQGIPLVFEPPAAVTLDRLAWLLSGTRVAAVPGTPVSAWLLSVLPLPQTNR